MTFRSPAAPDPSRNLLRSRIRGGRRFSWYSDCSQLCIGARLLLFAVAAVISSCYSCSCRSFCCSCFLLLFTCFYSSASTCFLLLPLFTVPAFPAAATAASAALHARTLAVACVRVARYRMPPRLAVSLTAGGVSSFFVRLGCMSVVLIGMRMCTCI